MTENEKRKEGDYLMTCFVRHVNLLPYTFFFRNSCSTIKLVVYQPLTNLRLTSVDFLLIIETLIIIFIEKVSCLKWVLRKRRYTEHLLLKYVVRRVILVYRPHSLQVRDFSFCMPVQRRDSSKELSWFGRLNQILETTTMR